MKSLLAGLLIPALASAQGYHFEAGQELTYKLDYANVTITDARALFSAEAAKGPSPFAQTIESKVKANVVRTVIRETDSTWIVAWSFRDAQVMITSGGVAEPESSVEVAKELALPVMTRVARSGAIREIWFPSTAGNLTQSFATSMLGSLQFTVPAKHGKTWMAYERDAAGNYVARYTTGDDGRISRRKIEYLRVPITRTNQPVVTQETRTSGGTRAAVEEGRLVSLQGVDSQAVFINDRRLAHGNTRVQLTLAKSERAPASYVAALGQLSEGKAVANVPDDEAMIQRTELGDRTPQSLIDELAARERLFIDTASTTGLYLKFKALAYLYPKKVAELGVLLSVARANGPSMEILSSALSVVGSPEAQNALMEAMRTRESEWPAMAALIPSLGGVVKPLPSAITYMRHLAFESTNPDVATTARLALGMMARQVSSDRAQSQAIVLELVSRLESATIPMDKSGYILALGNTAASEAMPAIAAYSSDSNAVLRASVMTALRWIADEKAKTILEAAAKSDPDSTVREAAQRALNDRARR